MPAPSKPKSAINNPIPTEIALLILTDTGRKRTWNFTGSGIQNGKEDIKNINPSNNTAVNAN